MVVTNGDGRFTVSGTRRNTRWTCGRRRRPAVPGLRRTCCKRPKNGPRWLLLRRRSRVVGLRRPLRAAQAIPSSTSTSGDRWARTTWTCSRRRPPPRNDNRWRTASNCGRPRPDPPPTRDYPVGRAHQQGGWDLKECPPRAIFSVCERKRFPLLFLTTFFFFRSHSRC